MTEIKDIHHLKCMIFYRSMSQMVYNKFNLDRAITLFMFFPLGALISYVFLNITTSTVLKDYGDFLAAITALIAVAITILIDKGNKKEKIYALKNICENELKSYNDQIVDFFLFFKYQDGIFLQRAEWTTLKERFPNSPDIYKNYDLLSELDINFINAISSLIEVHLKIEKIIRSIDDCLSNQNNIDAEKKIKLLQNLKFLEEKYMVSYNKISTKSKYILPQDSIINILNNIKK